MEKTCSRCGKTQPIDQFCKAAGNRDGRTTDCRSCRTEIARRRRDSPAVRAVEVQRRRDRKAAGVRYPSEALKVRLAPTEQQLHDRQVRHRQSQRVAAARHQAVRFGSAVNDLTVADWREVLAEHDYCCAYCGRAGLDLWIEHVVPFAKSGDNTKANVVPGCESCNRKKARRSDLQFRNGLCEAGHPRSGENVYTYPDGRKTACKPCRREAQRRSRMQSKVTSI